MKKALLVELDQETATRLDRIAPARSRGRSEFVRAAIRRALWEVEERATEAAYRRQPDSADDVHVDADVWEPGARRRRGRRPRRR
jgi:predicted transcriptional regulator